MAMQTATATFTGVEQSVAVVYSAAMTGNYGISHGVTVTDGLGPDVVEITNRTQTGCTVNVTPFVGTVELSVWDKP